MSAHEWCRCTRSHSVAVEIEEYRRDTILLAARSVHEPHAYAATAGGYGAFASVNTVSSGGACTLAGMMLNPTPRLTYSWLPGCP